MDAGIIFRGERPLYILTAYTEHVPEAVPDGRSGQYAANTKWSEFAAFAILVALPVAVVYFFLQRYIISGLTVGGVKG